MQMQAIKQNGRETKQCKQHASDKAKQVRKVVGKCRKQCKSRKMMQKAESDAKGTENYAKERKSDVKCGKRCKVRKMRQNGVQNQNKGVGNMHWGCSKPKKRKKAENSERSEIGALKWLSAICKYWMLGTPVSNVGC